MTITKIQQLPESLVQEVSDFVDFLWMKRDSARWQLWTHFTEALEMAASDFADYLSNLEEYEDRLARGAIQRALLPSHAFVPAGAGGLSRDSVALCEQIRVIDKRRITRVLGHLDEPDLEEIAKALRTILGL